MAVSTLPLGKIAHDRRLWQASQSESTTMVLLFRFLLLGGTRGEKT